MTIEDAKAELEKFVNLKTTMRPTFVDVLLNAEPVKHGHWIPLGKYDRECSVCYGIVDVVNYRYCPNCGAKMDL